MSERWVPRSDSPWSSERERAQQELRRDDPGDESGSEEITNPATRTGSTPSRSSRRTRRTTPSSSFVPRAPERRTPTTRTERTRAPSQPPPPENTGRGDGGGELPDLPGGSGSGGGNRNNRVLILGALLFLGMAAIAILPQLLGDDSSNEPTPTPQLIQTPTPPSGNKAPSPTPPNELADAEYVVCVDAGHGGWDTGWVREANSRAPGIEESDINLGLSWMLKEKLEAQGIRVVMTRPSGLAVNLFDQDVNGDGETRQDGEQAGDRDELQARINICNEAGADILISVHLNGVDNPAARGYEVLYTPAPFREFGDLNADLATYVYREIGDAYNEVGFETQARGAKPDTELEVETHNYGSEEHLIMTGPAIQNADYTITPSAMPGIIIEPVFISNDDDAAFIAVPANQEVLAEAYTQGILTYFEQHPGAS